MEPEISAPKHTPEQSSVEYGQLPERAISETSIETGLERAPERREQAAESGAKRTDDIGMPAILPSPVAIPPIVSDDSAHTSSPLSASDDDLIEKEWVDKAKKIVSDTKDDPYKREKAVNELQRDYLKKRYGRELGEAS